MSTDFLTTAQAAVRLGIKPRRVCALIAAERLPAEKRGRAYVIRAKDVEAYRRPERPSKLTPEQWQQAIFRYRDGEPAATLAPEFGISKRALQQRLKAEGLLRPRGESQQLRFRTTLPAVIADPGAYAVARYATGESPYTISRALGWGIGGRYRVRRLLEARGVTLRTIAEAACERWKKESPRRENNG